MGQLPYIRAIAGRRENLCWQSKAGSLKNQRFSVRAEGNCRVVSICDDLFRLRSRARRHCVYGLLRFVLRGEINRLAVRRPREFVSATVKTFGTIFVFS